MITLRTRAELERIREAGRVTAEALRAVREALRPGVSTKDLDELVREYVASRQGILLFRNYQGFPANCCISINDEVVHGIPRARRRLREGDVVSVDVGVKLRGYCGDSAWTFPVGTPADAAARLLEAGERALYRGIAECRPGRRISDIGRAIQEYVEGEGYNVVKKYVGHGIGTRLHEPPQVPNYVDRRALRQDPELRPGMVLAIEPMVNAGSGDVRKLDDGWTVVTADGGLSVHFEHTVAVTEGDPWILTALEAAESAPEGRESGSSPGVGPEGGPAGRRLLSGRSDKER
mgnify:CR=1 FL=1